MISSNPVYYLLYLEGDFSLKVFDTWLARVTSISQVIIMILALLGFFYTVVPMYQNQLVEEQYARTRLANLEAQDKLRVTEDQIEKLKGLNEGLVERREKLEANIDEVSQELSVVQEKLSTKSAALSATLSDLSSARKQLSKTQRSLEKVYFVRLAQAAEWMGITGSPLDECDRFATPSDSNQASHCTPFRYIEASLSQLLKDDVTDASGHALMVPQEFRKEFVERARELLSEHQLQLDQKSDYKKEIKAVTWFFERVRKQI